MHLLHRQIGQLGFSTESRKVAGPNLLIIWILIAKIIVLYGSDLGFLRVKHQLLVPAKFLRTIRQFNRQLKCNLTRVNTGIS